MYLFVGIVVTLDTRLGRIGESYLRIGRIRDLNGWIIDLNFTYCETDSVWLIITEPFSKEELLKKDVSVVEWLLK